MNPFENIAIPQKPEQSVENPVAGFISPDYLKNRIEEKKIIDFVDCPPEVKKHVENTIINFPNIGIRFFKIKSDPYLKNEKGIFTGGYQKRGGGSFEISLGQKYFCPGSEKEYQALFDHEWGHAMLQHIRDVQNFFSYNNLELPQSVSRMIKFINSFIEPGLRNLLKSPKRFLREYVSLYGETTKGDENMQVLEEKFAELFMLANSGSQRDIARQFREIFTPDAFSADWSSGIHDQKVLDNWNRLFRPDRVKREEKE